MLHDWNILEVTKTDVMTCNSTLLRRAVDCVVGDYRNTEQTVIIADKHDT